MRDLVCHLIIDAQNVLITLVTPAETEPTVDAVTYWNLDRTSAVCRRAARRRARAARASLEKIAGAPIPVSFSDKDALLIGTGRRIPTDEEKAALGELAARLPLRLG